MSVKQKDVGSNPAHDQKIFYAGFFRLGETFFRNFLMSPKPPFIFFLFCKRIDVQKLPKATFYIFRHYATYRIPKKFKTIFEKNFEKKFQNSDFFQFFPHAGTVEKNT